MTQLRNRKTTPQDRLRIVQLIAMGHSHQSIADLYEITRQRIGSIMKESKEPLNQLAWITATELGEPSKEQE